MSDYLQIDVVSGNEIADTDFQKSIFELNNQISVLEEQADRLDYFVAVSSGILCGMLDICWGGEFNFERGRSFSGKQTEEFVKRVARAFGCKDDDVKSCVAYLEKMFPLAADGNTPDFGGGLQHHLRDFAHHPTIAGLLFSLLTQFTGMSYGTDTVGNFIVVPVVEKSKQFIGKDVPDKIFKGTVMWFFHLISDMVGSSSTAGIRGGTGIPGPLLSLVKEVSVLPVISDITVNEESMSKFLSKLFNGTFFAKHDEAGRIIKGTEIKLDFRGELGVLAETGRQAVPVIANEVIVRSFYFVRRLAIEISAGHIAQLSDLKKLNWEKINPFGNPTVTRMVTIAAGVFSVVDVTEAVISQKYFVSVNYVGIGRFTVSLGNETINLLKVRNVKKIRDMYEKIERNTYTKTDDQVYGRLGETIDIDKFGLTLEQTEILYNLELHKVINDINSTKIPVIQEKIVTLKTEWIAEWKNYMSAGFPGFVQDNEAVLHWYSGAELLKKIEEANPKDVWFRLILLEAMLFEPYYPLSIEKDNDGKEIPGRRYKDLQNSINGYKKGEGDRFLDEEFGNRFCQNSYVKRLRKTYDKVKRELNEVLKSTLMGLVVAASITALTILTAGMFAPTIAVALVGSQFIGLSGAALTSACLAYLGGGAIAAGGLGMAGGTMAIVGGGAILGLSVGTGVGGGISAVSILGKKSVILQSAKLMVSVQEIFLNDEHDIEYSNTVYEKYVRSIAAIEKKLVELKLKETVAGKDEKKQLRFEIKNMEDSVHTMKIAMKNMNKFQNAFVIGNDME